MGGEDTLDLYHDMLMLFLSVPAVNEGFSGTPTPPPLATCSLGGLVVVLPCSTRNFVSTVSHVSFSQPACLGCPRRVKHLAAASLVRNTRAESEEDSDNTQGHQETCRCSACSLLAQYHCSKTSAV